ncbi:mRNA decay protein [Entomophthora muscae]|uniref:mRNA decay protein n=1 Tax=Entomophthora muscae TaxID=34485 RepID=A0ACC2TW56_9FUNG|nr:mRNA decay protein [Entomophthora muscae]
MAIPSDSSLVINTLNKQKAEKVEQQQLKEIVLSLEENLDHEAERDFEQDLAKQGVRLIHPKARPLIKTNKATESNTLRASDFGLKSRDPRVGVKPAAIRPPDQPSECVSEVHVESFPPLSLPPTILSRSRGRGKDARP